MKTAPATPALERTDNSERSPDIGTFHTFTVSDGLAIPGFAEAGDTLLAKFLGRGRDLPPNTPQACKLGLVGEWLLVKKAENNPSQAQRDHTLLQVDRFGRDWLTGFGWNRKQSRLKKKVICARWHDDAMFQIVSVRRAQGRTYQDDVEFCIALEACGFNREAVKGTCHGNDT